MVAYYPFNGSADDKSGSGHSGTVSGATLAGDRFGAAGSSYSFDGTSNFIEANLGTVLSCPITMSVWFLSDQIVSPTRGLASIPSLTYQSGLRLGFENGKVEGGSQGGAGPQALYSPFAADSKWHHALLVTTPEGLNSLYLDGSLVSTSQRGNGYSSNLPIQIGRELIDPTDDGSGNRYFRGSIDDVRVYNRSLSLSEVAALYSSEAPPKPQFQIIQGSYTWHQAKADAEARGGRLAVLNTQAKIDDADTLVATNGYPQVWIGLTDEVQEGMFRFKKWWLENMKQ
jgi:hypothetical protein